MNRFFRAALFLLVLSLTGCTDGVLTGPNADTNETTLSTTASLQRAAFPDIIPLPNGFQPEGIAIGPGTRFYAGSLANGSIYSGDLRTGEGSLLVTPPAGRIAVGLDIDERSGLLWVAGGPTGGAYAYDATTGDEIAAYDFSGGFVNDVIVTRTAAYFTDSFRPVLYRVPLGPAGRPISNHEEIPIGGDFTFVQNAFNANGIVATPNGEALIIVNSATGTLYTVNPASGDASTIDGVSTPGGDGLLLDGGRTLYVVQNFLNQIAVIDLRPDLVSGELAELLTDPAFRIPTTVADHGRSLYAVNARFDILPTPNTEYDVVRVRK